MKHSLRIIIFPVLIAIFSIALYQTTQIQELVNKKLHIAHQYFYTTVLERDNDDLFNNNRLDTENNHHLFATEMSVSRGIAKVILAREQSEGAGARVRRSIGTPQLRNFSPFLMLDHFSIKPGAGFPDQ